MNKKGSDFLKSEPFYIIEEKNLILDRGFNYKNKRILRAKYWQSKEKWYNIRKLTIKAGERG